MICCRLFICVIVLWQLFCLFLSLRVLKTCRPIFKCRKMRFRNDYNVIHFVHIKLGQIDYYLLRNKLWNENKSKQCDLFISNFEKKKNVFFTRFSVPAYSCSVHLRNSFLYWSLTHHSKSIAVIWFLLETSEGEEEEEKYAKIWTIHFNAIHFLCEWSRSRSALRASFVIRFYYFIWFYSV